MSGIEYKDLPKLTPKQRKALEHYLLNGNKADAYRNAYVTKNMSTAAAQTEALRLFENPRVTLWLEYHQEKAAQKFDVTYEDQIKILAIVQRGGIKVKVDAQGNKVMADPKATVSASTEISRMKGFHAPINSNIGLSTDKIENENADTAIIDKLLTAITTKPKRKVRKKSKP